VRLTDRDGLAGSDRHDADGRGRTVRRDTERLEDDLGDDESGVRGSSRPMAPAHRIIIANSLGRTCGRQRPG